MNYCRGCRRFFSVIHEFCPYCGSSENTDLCPSDLRREAGGNRVIPGGEITLNEKEYTVRGVIGSGGYGIVIEVSPSGSNDLFAMKVPFTFENFFFPGEEYSEKELTDSEASLNDELNVLGKISGDGIIKIIDSGMALIRIGNKESCFQAVLMELAFCTLKELIMLETSGKIDISVEEKLEMAGQVIGGLSDIHRSGIIHRDIALENIFVVDRAGSVCYVMADFGTSRERIRKREDKTTGIVGRDKYLDPLRFDRRYRRDPRIDVYTAGIVITEILIGDLWDNIIFEPLYEIDFEREFLRNYASGHIDKRVVKFISKALKPDIAKRYKDAVGMKLKFDKLRSEILKNAGEKRMIRMVDLVYNVQVPPVFPSELREETVLFENHKRMNIDAGSRTVIVFRSGMIRQAEIEGKAFVKVDFEGNKVFLFPDMRMIKKAFGFFSGKNYSGDRGILYFTNRLKIESIAGDFRPGREKDAG